MCPAQGNLINTVLQELPGSGVVEPETWERVRVLGERRRQSSSRKLDEDGDEDGTS